jgi:hypothetical protein
LFARLHLVETGMTTGIAQADTVDLVERKDSSRGSILRVGPLEHRMNSAIPPRAKNRNGPSAWLFRLALGAIFVGVSVWGIALCHEIFRSSVRPESLPGDSGFASLAAWAAWALFFAPLAVGGMALVWSGLRKMGALDRFAFWLEERTGRPNALVADPTQFGGSVRGGTHDDPHGLESLNTETVQRLQRTAGRVATILGGLVGAFLLGVGVFGLAYLLISSRADAGNSIYNHFAVGRAMTAFALSSGMMVLLGFTILQKTYRRDNSGWLFPLRVFTYIILRRQASERTGLAGQRQSGTKQLPRV